MGGLGGATNDIEQDDSEDEDDRVSAKTNSVALSISNRSIQHNQSNVAQISKKGSRS